MTSWRLFYKNTKIRNHSVFAMFWSTHLKKKLPSAFWHSTSVPLIHTIFSVKIVCRKNVCQSFMSGLLLFLHCSLLRSNHVNIMGTTFYASPDDSCGDVSVFGTERSGRLHWKNRCVVFLLSLTLIYPAHTGVQLTLRSAPLYPKTTTVQSVSVHGRPVKLSLHSHYSPTSDTVNVYSSHMHILALSVLFVWYIRPWFSRYLIRYTEKLSLNMIVCVYRIMQTD